MASRHQPPGDQYALPFGESAPPRRRRGESPDVHAAVVALRRAGRPVYRLGRLHRVEGRICTTAELLWLRRNLVPSSGGPLEPS